MSPTRAATQTFPNTFESIPTGRLLAVFEAAPGRLRRALEGLSTGQLAERPFAGKWTAGEQALHLADSELVGAVRFLLALAEPGSKFPMYDQDVWCETLRYRDASRATLEAALESFGALRGRTVALLASAAPDAWSRAGVHAVYGPLTLRQLLELYTDHAELHIDRILRTRAMIGVPVELEPQLDRKLVPETEGPWPA